MTVSKTLRQPARAVAELTSRFSGESSKTGKNNGQPVKGPAGFPNRPKSRDLLMRLGMTDKESERYLSDKRTVRQRAAAMRIAIKEDRFTMPERDPDDVADAALRIVRHCETISGQHGSDKSAKARRDARMAGIYAKMEVDSTNHRVNGSDPFAAMRAECYARIGLHIGFERKAPKKSKPASNA